MTDLEKVLEDVSSTYSIPLSDLKLRYVDGMAKTPFSCSNTNLTSMATPKPGSTRSPEQDKEQQQPPPKRRGRKKKQKEEVVEMEEYVYDDKTFLIDENNNVYSFDLNAPHLIGERFVDGTIRFF